MMKDQSNKSKTTLWILLPGMSVLFIQYVWKYLFMGGLIPGIYWLFVLVDRWYIHSLAFSVGGCILFLLLMIFAKKILFSKLSLMFLVASIAIVVTLPITFAQNSTHLESIRVNGLVYHLGAYPFLDVNYTVVKCDPLGIFCRKLYRSYDVTSLQWRRAHLTYDENTHELRLNEPEEGLLFTYPID